jgi:hypothetical protein
MPQQRRGDNHKRLEMRGGRGKCRREDKRLSGFIFGRVRHPALGLEAGPVAACGQGQAAASQMTLVGGSPRSMAFEGITRGNEDEKDSDSVG